MMIWFGVYMFFVDLEVMCQKLVEDLVIEIDDEDLNGYLMYFKVFIDYMVCYVIYGLVCVLLMWMFFYGMELGQEIEVEIDFGKMLEIWLQIIGDIDENGDVWVFFDLNGQLCVICVLNCQVKVQMVVWFKVDFVNDGYVGVLMLGVVVLVVISVGQKVSFGDLLLIIEVMKMEIGLYVDCEGIIKVLYVSVGQGIDVKDLLVEIE